METGLAHGEIAKQRWKNYRPPAGPTLAQKYGRPGLLSSDPSDTAQARPVAVWKRLKFAELLPWHAPMLLLRTDQNFRINLLAQQAMLTLLQLLRLIWKIL